VRCQLRLGRMIIMCAGVVEQEDAPLHRYLEGALLPHSSNAIFRGWRGRRGGSSPPCGLETKNRAPHQGCPGFLATLRRVDVVVIRYAINLHRGPQAVREWLSTEEPLPISGIAPVSTGPRVCNRCLTSYLWDKSCPARSVSRHPPADVCTSWPPDLRSLKRLFRMGSCCLRDSKTDDCHNHQDRCRYCPDCRCLHFLPPPSKGSVQKPPWYYQ